MNKAQRPLAQSIQDARKYESWFWALIIEVMEGAGLFLMKIFFIT